MKTILSILLAVLVLGACGTATMDAKKKVQRKAKAKTTSVSTSKVASDVESYCSYLQKYNENAVLGEYTEDMDQQVEQAREAAELAISIAELRPKIRTYENTGKLSRNQISKIKRLEAKYNRYN